MPVKTEEEALAFIEAVRKEFWDATHNVYAYQIGENDEIQRQSDDGEPSGTAGRPALEVIRKEGLKDVAVVVTRYFGGILLGASGLIRAYGQGAKVGLEAAKIVRRILHVRVAVEIDYTWLGKVQNEIGLMGYRIVGSQYTDKVTLEVMVPEGQEDHFVEKLTDLTNARCSLEKLGLVYATEIDGKLVFDPHH